MQSNKQFPSQTHAFVIRIWWELDQKRYNGLPMWRGQIQHAASGRTRVFQSLRELLEFIQDQTGKLEPINKKTSNSDRYNK